MWVHGSLKRNGLGSSGRRLRWLPAVCNLVHGRLKAEAFLLTGVVLSERVRTGCGDAGAASRYADKFWGAARLGVRGTEGMEAEEEKLG